MSTHADNQPGTAAIARKILVANVKGAKGQVEWAREQFEDAQRDLAEAEAALAELDALEQAGGTR